MSLINDILEDLTSGSLMLVESNFEYLNNLGVSLYMKKDLTKQDQEDLKYLLTISNILYNDTTLQRLPLVDEVYDTLMAKYCSYGNKMIIGAKPINFDNENIPEDIYNNKDRGLQDGLIFVDRDYENEMFSEVFDHSERNIGYESFYFARNPLIYTDLSPNMVMTAKQRYPDLVGTLNKCKFVLTAEAEALGVQNDANVKILERDFFQPLLVNGTISPQERFNMVLELKYDGESVVGTIHEGFIIEANGRGDTEANLTCDYTPFLYGYNFPAAMDIKEDIGVKWEAIMMEHDLKTFNELRGKNYKNCRSGIVGLTGRLDASLYRDLITLIPLAVSIPGVEMDRIEEIEFMNKYLIHNGQKLRYCIIHGNYMEILYQIKKFKDEADYARNWLPFMYDGIVVSFLDSNIRKKLGRQNNVNLFSMAVKFNPLRRETFFRGYDFTVGQDGSITPMIFYDAVEFYGTIHMKSSGHSLARFNELQLRAGDIINVEYTNDVMPYVTKPDNSHNENNPNPIIPFIENCPICGTKLIVSKSLKTAKCPNINCKGRAISRMANMMDKLGLKDFAEATMEQINLFHLSDLLRLNKESILFLGEVNAQKFIDRMTELKTTPIYDFIIMGALGFDGIAVKTWRLILNLISISDIYKLWLVDQEMHTENLKRTLVQIKGIGPTTADTIVNQMEYFLPDIQEIVTMGNIVPSIGLKYKKIIRWTGLRRPDIDEMLINKGYDSDGDAGVTKNTDILIVVDETYSSSKTAKAIEYGIPIVPFNDFMADMDKWL